jgi:hypothetical protein
MSRKIIVLPKKLEKLYTWWNNQPAEEKWGAVAVLIILVCVASYVLFVSLYEKSKKEGCLDACLERVEGHITNCYFETDNIFSDVPENYSMLKCSYVVNESMKDKFFYIHANGN